MKYIKFSNGFQLPLVGLGTWGIGGFLEPDYSKDDYWIELISKAVEIGYTHIDTAELYASGHTEELIGKVIKELDRSKLIITSKVFQNNLHYDDVIKSCINSISRLNSDYVDIYLIHGPNQEISLKETIDAMNYLVKKGYIRNIGVSNFSVKLTELALKYLEAPLITNQIPYNLCIRNYDYKQLCSNMELEIIPFCQRKKITITAYRPLERGLFLKPNQVLDSLEEKYQKTKTQIAIKWLISKENIITIPKAGNIYHLKENINVFGWQIEREDLESLDILKFDNSICKG